MNKPCKPVMHKLLLVAVTSSLCACISIMPARQEAKPVVEIITIENESIFVYLSNILAASTEVQKKELLQLSLSVSAQTASAESALVESPLTESQRNNAEYAKTNAAASSPSAKTPLPSSAALTSKDKLQNQQDNQAGRQTILPRIRLAALYGMPNSRVRDTAKAQSLLDELVRDPALNNENRLFVGLLRDYLTDTAKLGLRLREEQKRADTMQLKNDNWQSKLEAAQNKAESAQQKADTLQRKLDELKNIEKTMLDRSQGIR